MQLPSPIPHPLAWWDDCPGWVREALEWVVGVEWPEGNEKLVWDLADLWYQVGPALQSTVSVVEVGGRTAVAGFGGPTTAVGAVVDLAWLDIAGGPDADLPTLIGIFDEVAKLVESCGCDIEGAKIEMYVELGIMVLELLATAIAAACTFGAASAAAPVVVGATRWAIQQIFKRLLHELLRKGVKAAAKQAAENVVKKVSADRLKNFTRYTLRHAAEEGVEEFAVDYGTQLHQIDAGRRRDGLDERSLLASFGGGAAGGAFGGLAGLGPNANNGLARFGEKILRGAGGEVLAETGAGLVMGDLPGLDNLARSATSGGVSGTLDHTRDSLNEVKATFLADKTAGIADSPVDLSALAPPPAASPTGGLGAGLSTDPGTGSPTGLAGGGSGAGGPSSDPGGPTYDASSHASPSVDSGHTTSTSTTGTATTSTSTTGTATTSTTGTGTTWTPPSAVVASAHVDFAGATLAPQAPAGLSEVTGQTTTPTSPTAGPVQTGPIQTGPAHTGPTLAGPTVAAPIPGPTSPTVPVAPQGLASALPAGPETIGRPPTAGSPTAYTRSATVAPPSPTATPTTPTTPAPTAPTPTAPIPTAPRPTPPAGPAVADPTGHASHVPVGHVLGLRPAAPDPSSSAPNPPARPRRPLTENEAEHLRLERVNRWGHAEYDRRFELKDDIENRQIPDVEERLYDARNALHRAIDTNDWSTAAQIEERYVALQRELADLRDQADAALDPPTGAITVADDMHRILNTDYADVATGGVTTDDQSVLTGDGRPPPVEASRAYFQRGGHRPPMEYDQLEVERLIPRDEAGRPRRMPKPYLDGDVRVPARWFARMNDSGPGADPTRGINCVDCVLSLFDTWLHGRPRVSAPRTFDAYLDGDVRQPIGGQRNGLPRATEVLGTSFTTTYSQDSAITATPQEVYEERIRELERTLLEAGPGAFAMISNEWRDGGGHTWAAVNFEGEIVYLDPQEGMVSQRPLYNTLGPHGLTRMDVAIVDGNGHPVHVVPDPLQEPWHAGDPTGDIDPSRPDPRLMPQRRPDGHVNPAAPPVQPDPAVQPDPTVTPDAHRTPAAKPGPVHADLSGGTSPAAPGVPTTDDPSQTPSTTRSTPDPRTLRERMLEGHHPPADTQGSSLPPSRPTAPQAWDGWKQREGAEWQQASVADVAARYGLEGDPEAVANLNEAYTITRDHIAPFVVQVASAMLADFRASVETEPGRQFVFVGRDGDPLALAMQELDPQFYSDHCAQITASRKLAMLAVFAEEGGLNAPEENWIVPPGFRWTYDVGRGETVPTPEDIEEARRSLPLYMADAGIRLGDSNCPITLVDSSFKGTMQVMLSAVFTETPFDAALIWHGKIAADPGRGTKVGYAVDLPVGYDPADDPKTETLVYEDLMRGPLSSPMRFVDDRPFQQPESEVNPYGSRDMRAIAAERYRNLDPPSPRSRMRDAILDLNRSAVRDYSRHISTEMDPSEELFAGFQAYRRMAHIWRFTPQAAGLPGNLVTFLDSFVRGGRRRR